MLARKTRAGRHSIRVVELAPADAEYVRHQLAETVGCFLIGLPSTAAGTPDVVALRTAGDKIVTEAGSPAKEDRS